MHKLAKDSPWQSRDFRQANGGAQAIRAMYDSDIEKTHNSEASAEGRPQTISLLSRDLEYTDGSRWPICAYEESGDGHSLNSDRRSKIMESSNLIVPMEAEPNLRELGQDSDWNRRWLVSLVTEARGTPNGISSETLRGPTGQILALIVCVTEPERIQAIERALRVSIEADWVDSRALTLTDIVYRAKNAGDLACLSADEGGNRVMVICAASHRYFRVLEDLTST